jgi:alkylhydroperoxidase family enzyme
MIDSTDCNLSFALQEYCQSHERLVALLAFLDVNLPEEQHDAFLALAWQSTQGRAEATLVAAAKSAKGAGLDAVAIVEAASVKGTK